MPNDVFVEHCLELLAPAGAVRARRMFGGHGLYVDELFVAIVVAERLYLKVDPTSRAQFEAAGGEPFRYTRAGRVAELGFWSPPADAMDSPAQMRPWAQRAVQAALSARTRPAPVRSARRR